MRTVALILYGISGLCLLSLETIWIRAIGLHVGGTAVASALVLVVFFLCAAAGNLAGAALSRGVKRPLAAYGLAELLTAISAFALFSQQSRLAGLLGPGCGTVPGNLLGDALFAAALAGLPSFLAGASFPLLSAALVSRLDERTRHAGAIYAGNLFGAALGVVLGGVALPAAVGYSGAMMAVCALLGAEGIAACLLRIADCGLRIPDAGGQAAGGSGKQKARLFGAQGGEARAAAGEPVLGPLVVFASGVLTIGLEVLCLIWFRQIRQASVYALAATLFAFIVGLGGGAAAAAVVRRRGVAAGRALAWALASAGILAFVYPFLFHGLQRWSASRPLPNQPIVDSMKIALISTALLLPLLLAAGAVLPLAWELARRRDSRHGRAVGLLTALNKVGAAAGAVAAPLVVLPAFGLPGAIMLAGAVYLLLAWLTRARLGDWAGRPVRLAPVLLLGALAATAWFLRPAPYVPAAGEKVLAVDEGAGGIVATTDDPAGSRHIVLDQFYVLNGTGNSLLSQKQESWIPLTLAPNPQRVLFIGMASGISANAALDFPIAQLDTAELVPGVVRAARTHFGEWNERLFRDPRARIRNADGRRVVQAAAPQSWDAIICDLLLPASEGTSALYSRDFLKQAADRLSPDGLFCLWLPLYQHDAAMAGTVIRTFAEVFPCAIALRGNFDPVQPTMALIGSRKPLNLSGEFLAERLASAGGRRAATESPAFRSVANFRLLFQGDLAAVRNSFAGFPVITDDRPVFAFLGPRPPARGQALRGNVLLEWFGGRFQNAPMPSCRLEDTPADEVRRGLDAGNYYLSAAIQNVSIPEASLEQQLNRMHRAAGALQMAQSLAPASTLRLEDLGR